MSEVRWTDEAGAHWRAMRLLARPGRPAGVYVQRASHRRVPQLGRPYRVIFSSGE